MVKKCPLLVASIQFGIGIDQTSVHLAVSVVSLPRCEACNMLRSQDKNVVKVGDSVQNSRFLVRKVDFCVKN